MALASATASGTSRGESWAAWETGRERTPTRRSRAPRTRVALSLLWPTHARPHVVGMPLEVVVCSDTNRSDYFRPAEGYNHIYYHHEGELSDALYAGDKQTREAGCFFKHLSRLYDALAEHTAFVTKTSRCITPCGHGGSLVYDLMPVMRLSARRCD